MSDCRSRGREFDPGLVPYFVEIDHEIISTVILLPSAESFKKNVLQFQTLFSFFSLIICWLSGLELTKGKNIKQGRPWSDCFFRSSLIWVCTVCLGLFCKQMVFAILEPLLYHLWNITTLEFKIILQNDELLSLELICYILFGLWFYIPKSRPRGRGFEPHQHTVLCPWARHIYPCLVLVQPRKTVST